MIEIHLTNNRTEDTTVVEWPAVPTRGDRVQIGTRDYRVVEVVWHLGKPHVAVWIEEL